MKKMKYDYMAVEYMCDMLILNKESIKHLNNKIIIEDIEECLEKRFEQESGSLKSRIDEVLNEIIDEKLKKLEKLKTKTKKLKAANAA